MCVVIEWIAFVFNATYVLHVLTLNASVEKETCDDDIDLCT